nr:gamma-crystallin M2-like isoform X1 [Oncorhynchus nerka]
MSTGLGADGVTRSCSVNPAVTQPIGGQRLGELRVRRPTQQFTYHYLTHTPVEIHFLQLKDDGHSLPTTFHNHITFYEENHFQGRCYECSTDCADLHSYFSRCNSARVESGAWVLYEKPNYKGYQYILSPGEYTDNQQWMGFNDSVKSCRAIKNVYGNVWKLRLYERPDFGGQMVEWAEDCPSVYEAFKFREVYSCMVTHGAWAFYELPNYRGRQYFLERGEYPRHTDWSAATAAVGSFRRIAEF